MENISLKIESKEKLLWRNIRVFRVRHGNTPYNEQLKGIPSDDMIDLTEQGIKEIESASENISQKLNKDEDIVYLAHSPRKRTRDSAQIIKKYLTDKGFTVWEDPKERHVQNRIRSTDILDAEFKSISHDESAYAPAFRELLAEMKESVPLGTTPAEYWRQGGIGVLETKESVEQRSKDQLAFLMRIAHTIQPKIDKHIAVVEVEHEETLDELISHATNGGVSAEKGNGPATGEVFELIIPTDSDEIEINSLSRNIHANPVHFDYLKRDFKHESK